MLTFVICVLKIIYYKENYGNDLHSRKCRKILVMRLLLKQNLFSGLFGFKIYNQDKEVVYVVKRKFSLKHILTIYDSQNNELGVVSGDSFRSTAEFTLIENGCCIGSVTKYPGFLKPKYNIGMNGWILKGNILEWDYSIYTRNDRPIAYISVALGFSGTYAITVCNPVDALYVVMVVVAIDAEKSTRFSHGFFE